MNEKNIVLNSVSLLGILSLDLRNQLRVCYSGENVGFNTVLAKYAVQ